MSAAEFTTRRRLAGRRLSVAAALVALGAAAVVLFAGGSSTGGLGPAAALAQAAQQTADASSGVARTVVAAPDGAMLTIVTRFAGSNGETTMETRAADGRTETRAARLVDGIRYERVGDEPWAEVPADAPGVAAVQAEISNRGLVDLVQAASTVIQSGDTYTATVPASDLAGLDGVPLGISEAPIAEGAPVQIEVAGGLVRSITVDTQAGSQQVTYSELGQPQAITAPAVG